MGKRLISFVVTVMLLLTLIPDVALTAYAANTYSINGVNVRYDNFSSSPGECWVYANNFYNKIWGSKFTNSFSDTNNSLRNLSDSELLLTADHLEKYVTNAALGSCIRIMCPGKVRIKFATLNRQRGIRTTVSMQERIPVWLTGKMYPLFWSSLPFRRIISENPRLFLSGTVKNMLIIQNR